MLDRLLVVSTAGMEQRQDLNGGLGPDGPGFSPVLGVSVLQPRESLSPGQIMNVVPHRSPKSSHSATLPPCCQGVDCHHTPFPPFSPGYPPLRHLHRAFCLHAGWDQFSQPHLLSPGLLHGHVHTPSDWSQYVSSGCVCEQSNPFLPGHEE